MVLFIIVASLYFVQNFIMDIELGDVDHNGISQDENSAIYILEQKPSNIAIAAYAILEKPGYIVIHENNNGNFGKILGNSKLLPIGKSDNVFIGIIRQSFHGEIFFAVMYEDSGDGIFTPGVDVPFKTDFDDIIFTKFRINVDAKL